MTMPIALAIARDSVAAVVLGVAAAAAAHAQSQPQSPQSPTPSTPAPESTTAPADGAAVIASAFRRADVDGDGRLSSDELRQFPALAPRFADLDKDHDGFVSSGEFSNGVVLKKD